MSCSTLYIDVKHENQDTYYLGSCSCGWIGKKFKSYSTAKLQSYLHLGKAI